jgi:hypothetical protein
MNLDITKKWAKEIALMSDADFEENCIYIEILLARRKQALSALQPPQSDTDAPL